MIALSPPPLNRKPSPERRPGQPGSLFGQLVCGRQGVGGAMRYTFFPKHLPRPARVALEQVRDPYPYPYPYPYP